MDASEYQQLVAALRAELAALLTADNSPARQIPELDETISRCDNLQRQVQHLNDIRQKTLQLLEKIEAAERTLDIAKREVAAETLAIAKFAYELGSKVSSGVETGNLEGSLRFNAVKRSIEKIRLLEIGLQEYASQAGNGMAEALKKSGNRVKGFVQMKLEHRNLKHHQEVLGEVILLAGDEENFRCVETTETIDQILEQRGRVEASKEKQWNLEQVLNGLLITANKDLDRSGITGAATLRRDLEENLQLTSTAKQILHRCRETLVSEVITNPYRITDELVRDKLAAINKAEADIKLQHVANNTASAAAPNHRARDFMALIGIAVSFLLICGLCGGLSSPNTESTRDILQEFLDDVDNTMNADVFGFVTLDGSHASVTLEEDYYDKLTVQARQEALVGVRDLWFNKSFGTRITFRDAYTGREVASFVK